MRLIKTIPHPVLKIDLFHNQANYLLQISGGTVQVAYKFSRSSFSPEKIAEIVADPQFMRSSGSALEMLLQNQIAFSPGSDWEEEEIM